MVRHKREFIKFWGFNKGDYIACWVPGCTSGQPAVEIMHIDAKKMGGRESAEYIENYIPGCRHCHNKTGGNAIWRDRMYAEIVRRIRRFMPLHIWTEKFRETAYFKNNIMEKGTLSKEFQEHFGFVISSNSSRESFIRGTPVYEMKDEVYMVYICATSFNGSLDKEGLWHIMIKHPTMTYISAISEQMMTDYEFVKQEIKDGYKSIEKALNKTEKL